MKKILAFTVMFCTLATQAFGAITYTTSIVSGPFAIGGKSKQVVASINLAGTYEANGFTLTPSSFGLSHFESVVAQGEDGYVFFYVPSAGKVMAFQTATLTPSGTIAITPNAVTAGVPAGTNAAPALTMNANQPAGTNSAPALTMNAYQPEGTNAASAVTITHIADTTGLAAVYANTAGVLYAIFGDAANHDVAVPAQAFTGTTATLTGSVAAPVFTGTTATLTGSVAAPAFTGTTMGTHQHADTAAFTGGASTAAALAEVGAGTSLARIDKITLVITGW